MKKLAFITTFLSMVLFLMGAGGKVGCGWTPPAISDGDGGICEITLECSADDDCPIGVTGWRCIDGCCMITGCSCPLSYGPVCGKDNKTYFNPCEAGCAKAEIAHSGKCHGACDTDAGSCIGDVNCPDDKVCFEGACCEAVDW